MQIEILDELHSGNPKSAIDKPKFLPMPISCHKCIHYYVTWDQNFPHGCRGMGFKGRRYPMIAVRQVMNGKDCLLFVAKRTRNKQWIKRIPN